MIIDRNNPVCRDCLCAGCGYDDPETQTCLLSGITCADACDKDNPVKVCEFLHPQDYTDLCLALDVAAEFKRELDEWKKFYARDIVVVRARIWSLEDALQDMVDNCPVCGGSGYNRDATQTWDEPGVPIPKCKYCANARELLDSLHKEDE